MSPQATQASRRAFSSAFDQHEATQASRRAFSSAFDQHEAPSVHSSRVVPLPRRRKSGYSRLFFIALFVGVASSVGFVWVLISLLFGG